MVEHQVWCENLQSNLQNEDLRIDTLTRIRNHFYEVSSAEASQTANLLKLPLLFDCLNDSNPDQIDLACEVLTLCMSNLSVGESTNRYGDSLERALKHPLSSVKLMALKEIYRYTTNSSTIGQLCGQTSLILGLIECIADNDLSVANKTNEILTAVGSTDFGIVQLLQKRTIQDINRIMEHSDIVRFRVYELVVNIACSSNDCLLAVQSVGWLKRLIEELDGNDVLLQLNTLELLSTLVATQHGRTYLEFNNIHSKIAQRLLQIKENPLSSLLLPGLIRFFGNLAYWQPKEVFDAYPIFVSELFDLSHFNDLSILGVILDTIGHIAQTKAGKIALNSVGKMQTVLRYLGNLLVNLPDDYRLRALECIENVVHVTSCDQDSEICAITSFWFSSVSDNTIDLVFKYSQNPFPDTRIAGLSVMRAISEQVWGQTLIINTPGIFEFLLNRSEEHTKECKEIKYAIVKAFVGSLVLDSVMAERVNQFVKEGPYFICLQTEVAIEGMPT